MEGERNNPPVLRAGGEAGRKGEAEGRGPRVQPGRGGDGGGGRRRRRGEEVGEIRDGGVEDPGEGDGDGEVGGEEEGRG